jgi:hypothetical protein
MSLPLTIGLFAKWESGKSLLLPRIRDSMTAFSRSWLDGIELYWSWTLVLITFLISLLVSLLAAAIFSIFQEDSQLAIISIGIGLGIFLLLLCTYGLIYYGSEVSVCGNGRHLLNGIPGAPLERLDYDRPLAGPHNCPPQADALRPHAERTD